MDNLLDPCDILNIKRQYAQWKSGVNPHYPSDQEWFAQAGAQAYKDKLSKLAAPDKLRGSLADWLFNFILNYSPSKREEFGKYADSILSLIASHINQAKDENGNDTRDVCKACETNIRHEERERIIYELTKKYQEVAKDTTNIQCNNNLPKWVREVLNITKVKPMYQKLKRQALSQVK